MPNFLSKIKDTKLDRVIDSVPLGDQAEFKTLIDQFPKYDISFLWLLSYSREDTQKKRAYIEEGYKKFHKVLDRNFPRLFSRKGNFESRMWELILCDTLSTSGELQPKGARGADFILRSHEGQDIQIEAVAPDEAKDQKQRAPRPDYSHGSMSTFGGAIHHMERPIVLRALQAFSDKKDGYEEDQPLIIAINSSKTVGFTSDDTYVLRRILFGLGNWQVNRAGQWNFEQLPYYNKQGEEPFLVSYFRRPEFNHVSGVIYSSQPSLGFIPGGYSWHNSGITFVPNPLATNPVKTDFPFFKKILCDETSYQEVQPSNKFESKIPLT